MLTKRNKHERSRHTKKSFTSMHCTGIDSVLKTAKFANLNIPAQKHVTEYHITNIHIKQKSLQYEIEIEIEIDNKP